jgi:hypothetical protein
MNTGTLYDSGAVVLGLSLKSDSIIRLIPAAPTEIASELETSEYTLSNATPDSAIESVDRPAATRQLLVRNVRSE